MYTTATSAPGGKRAKGRITKKVLTERTSAAVASSSNTGEDFGLEDMDLALSDEIETEPISTAPSKEIANKPNYGEDLFRHVQAKLRQLDFRDVNDELIPPQDWYSQLRQGTLVMVYQLNAHTVRVLLPSLSDVEERKPTILDPDSSKKRTTSEAAALVSQVVLGKRPRK
ncbi:hypothetical protein L210DRAFT_3508377 [Boletus edulis BED1]|uniref:Uncharacterized protein n=1 Tax=Boletus edulis BED1 TaxID=1328754 RepID=A0AAD4BH87_BOLED|nr:hypothetical protein L210DRAFT_3508377 [Boletus edulis BED1]